MNLTITMSEVELKELLKKTIKPEYAEEMARCILANTLNDEAVLQMFVKVAMQVPVVCKYNRDEQLLCEMYALSSWNFDKEAMSQKKMLDSNQNVLVKVLEVIPYKPHPYRVQYSYINKGDGKLMMTEVWVKEENITGYPVLIGDTV